MSDLPVISISIFLPLLSALYIIFFVSQGTSKSKDTHASYVAILSSVLTFIATLYLLAMFDSSATSYQFVERRWWTPMLGLEYYVGVDGISLYFILLTSLLTVICIVGSLFTIQKQLKEFLLCFLLLESFCIGAFSALNLLLFFLFFEVILIPMYIIIGVWGGENRVYAAFKFFLYTFFGSVFFLISLIYIYTQAHTFTTPELAQIVPNFSTEIQQYLWLATFIAFAVKVPMLPFHTWLPDAHVQAPTAGSVILAGILLKLGAYGYLRILLPMMPQASAYFAEYVLLISAIAVIYGSLVALAQTDMKKMIAYSSVAHMGYVTAGIFSFTNAGLNGAIFQMISHALVSSALFLIVGILYERGHTKEISGYGGVAAKMPMLAVLFMVSMLGSVGLPGTSGFIGEFLSIIGVFKVSGLVGACVASGVVLGAIYMLKLYRQVMFGTALGKEVATFEDLKIYEMFALLPLIILIIYIGVMPNCIIKVLSQSTQQLVNLYGSVGF